MMSLLISFFVVLLQVILLAGTAADIDVIKAKNHKENRARRTLMDSGRRILYTNTELRCENSVYGNPCGPFHCTDTDNGYICDSPNVHTCPAGCAINSSCQLNADGMTSYCACDVGYERLLESLPCTKQENLSLLIEKLIVDEDEELAATTAADADGIENVQI
jgi:hypothetical protein